MTSGRSKPAAPAAERREPDPALRKEFAERLVRTLELRGYPPYGRALFARVAKEYNVTISASRKWLSGEGFPGIETLVRIANDLKISLDYLLRGVEILFDESSSDMEVRRSIALLELAKSFTLVPRAEARKIERGEHTREVIGFTRDWLEKHFGAEEGEIDTCEASGDAMAPEVRPGDVVVYRKGVKAFGDNGLYVLRQGATIKLRRVSLLADGRIKLACENRSYPPEIFPARRVVFGPAADPSKIAVLGRYVGSIRKAV